MAACKGCGKERKGKEWKKGDKRRVRCLGKGKEWRLEERSGKEGKERR